MVESDPDGLAGIKIRYPRQPIERLDVGYLRERAAHFRRLAALVSDDTFTREMMDLAAAYEARASQLEATNNQDRRAPKTKASASSSAH